MKYLINKINKIIITEDGIEKHPTILFAEGTSVIDVTEKVVYFLKTNSGKYEATDDAFFIAPYKLEEEVEITIK